MPLDILYEVSTKNLHVIIKFQLYVAYFQIFGHLRPYDILRIARTTKALRKTLMMRSAISVWKGARSNVEGLPDCPK